MTILVKKVFISSKPTFVYLLCPPLCGPFSIQESAAGGLSYKARNDVDYVITEYGIAKLSGKTLKQRTHALIEIAHPNFRDELKKVYEERFHCSYE